MASESPDVRAGSLAHPHLDACASCRALLAALVASHRPPRSFEEYRLERLLGEGETGEVWAAVDTRLDRPVAIKFLHRGAFDDRRRVRFAVEARAVARLRHPNVVGIHRAGEVDGRPYLVSELVEGRDLAATPRPQPAPTVLRWALCLSDALAEAHRVGVLHRDIKPANVMLTPAGELRLLDFGLAKLGGEPLEAGNAAAEPATALRATRTGTLVGTPLYLAPELWSATEATPQGDLYALGVVLYELLTGRTPFAAATADELYRQVTTREAPPLVEGGVTGKTAPASTPQLEERLAAIVARCLRRDPAERFASAQALHDALSTLQRDIEVGTAAASRARALRAPGRGPLTLAAVAIALALFVGGVGLALRGTKRASPPTVSLVSPVGAASHAVTAAHRRSLAVVDMRDRSEHLTDAWLAPALAALLEWQLGVDGKVRVVSGLPVQRMRRELSSELPATMGDLSAAVAERATRYLGVDALVLCEFGPLTTPPTDVAVPDGAAMDGAPQLRLAYRVVGVAEASGAAQGPSRDLFELALQVAAGVRRPLGVPAAAAADLAALRAAVPGDPVSLRLLAEGTWLADQLDLEAAQKVLERANQRSPGSPLVHLQLTRVTERRGMTARAREEGRLHYELSRSLSPEAQLRSEAVYAITLGDHERAAKLYGALWKLHPDSVPDGLLAAHQLATAGHLTEALAQNAALSKLPPQLGDDPWIELYMDLLLRKAGKAAEALASGLRSGTQARARGNRHILGRSHAVEGFALLGQGKLARAESAFLEGLPLLQAVGEHDEEMWALDGLARVRLRRGAVAAAIGSCNELLAKHASFHDPQLEMFMQSSCAMPQRAAGELARARQMSERALALCRASPLVECPTNAFASMATSQTLAGDLRLARRTLEECDGEKEAAQATDYGVRMSLVLGELLLHEGRFTEARTVLERAVALAEQQEAPRMGHQGRLLLARIDLAEGHAAPAAALARRAADAFAQEGAVDDELVARATWADATSRAGEHAAAQAALDSLRERAARSESIFARAAWAGAASNVVARGSPFDASAAASARAALIPSIAELDQSGFVPLAAEARLALAALERATGHVAAANKLVATVAAAAKARGLGLLRGSPPPR